MKLGDIIENPWTTQGKNPLHFSMYVGTTGKYIKSVYFYDGKIETARFYKEDKEQFKIIGHLKEYDDFKDALKELCKLESEVTK